jgi:hypothetical protein
VLLRWPRPRPLDESGTPGVQRLDAELALRLEAANHAPRGRRLGLEHEYAVFEGDRQIDFRAVIDSATVDGLPLHPANPYFYLTRSGIGLMADGVVAEIASPPERLRPGFAEAIEGWSAGGRRQLETMLPRSMSLEPGSTHISVETDPALNDALCNLYTRTFAPGLMLLMDNTSSPGMLCRPRPGRAELCGEFVDGVRLRAAAAYAAGSVLALERRLRSEASELPPVVEVTVEPGRQRYGWYVDRRAFGPDLYSEGRRSMLRSDSGSIAAQAQMEVSWQIAREALRGTASRADLEAADDLVSGRLALPCEQREIAAASRNGHMPAGSAFAGIGPISRGGLRLAPVSASWAYVVYGITEGARSAVVNVPEEHLGTFTRLAQAGQLDDLLAAYLDATPSGRILRSHAQTSAPGFYDAVQVSNVMLPPDRFGAGAGPLVRGRPGKVQLPPPPPPEAGGGIPWIPIRWNPPKWLPIGIGTGLIVTVMTTLVVTGGGGGGGVAATPTTVVQAPSPTPASAVVPPTPVPTTAVAAPTEPPQPTPVSQPTQLPIDLFVNVGPISATFSAPAQRTDYTVTQLPVGFSFAWSGPDCADWGPTDPGKFYWHHPHPPCDPTTNHADRTIQVVVTHVATNQRRVCTYQGAASGTGPACVSGP